MYICFLLLGLRPKSHVAFPLINIHLFIIIFFIACVSVGIFRAPFFFFFFFIDRMAWTECLSWAVRSSELSR